MIKQILLEGFNKNITSSMRSKGERVYNNDLIKDININCVDDCINIKSAVVSESLFSEYSCNIEIDNITKELMGTHCSCADYEKNEFRKDNYCCKHIVASFYEFLRKIDEDHSLREFITTKKENESEAKPAKTNSLLTELIDNNDKKEVRFEVILNKNNWSSKLICEFKIGIKDKSNKTYILRDINSFLLCLYNNVPVKISKNFEFSLKEYRLSLLDRRLIRFMSSIRKMAENDRGFKRSYDKLIDGKYMTIPDYSLKEFLKIIKNNRVYLGDGFFYRVMESEIIEKDIPIPFLLGDDNNELFLEAECGMPMALNSNEDVFLFKTSIYIPSLEQCERLAPYLKIFNATSKITFSKDEKEKVLKELIPSLTKTTDSLELTKNIQNSVVFAKPEFSFYFDKDKEIMLIFKVKYGGCEFNYFREYKEKVIYRDNTKENEVFAAIRRLNFTEYDDRFYFTGSDEEAFNFFKNHISKLQQYGDVYYSETFKGIKKITKSQFKGTIEHGKYDYFEFKFSLGSISEDEITDILRSFRDNTKYFKLKNGEFLDLEEENIKEVLTLLDNLLEEEIKNNELHVPLNKAIYLEDYLEEKGMRYIKGRSELKKLKKKLISLDNKVFKVPQDLNATLREYQFSGFNWLKTLDYLGFGGILGDEMGLGKTLQTIAFIASKPDTKTLITAPTSLIYNWNSEFKKFAPDIRVAIGCGTPEERLKLLNNRKAYDVYITTYNILRRDIDNYNMEFDHFIIDEAQNIKNASSQNAGAVKSIKAKTKFALTGTPLENSLMELWSIFDFIMPNYLFDEKTFTLRYYRRLEEGPEILHELNRMIKPFILRRYKKNVIKELPDKIEKRISVPLNDDQKVVYGTYSTYVKDLICKKVENSEFNKSRIEILAYITKLRQLCLDPSVVMNDYAGSSSKIECLLDLLSQSTEEGHKVLVFSQFTSVLKNIAKCLDSNNMEYSYLDGSVSSSDRIKLVEEFNSGDKQVFLISLKAGGTGLNLTSADIVIHFDPWWNPAVEDQATDRAHRIGQQNVVEVIKLICEGTIEEKIVDLQDSKRKLISNILGHELDNSSVMTLSSDDILNLFT